VFQLRLEVVVQKQERKGRENHTQTPKNPNHEKQKNKRVGFLDH